MLGRSLPGKPGYLSAPFIARFRVSLPGLNPRNKERVRALNSYRTLSIQIQGTLTRLMGRLPNPRRRAQRRNRNYGTNRTTTNRAGARIDNRPR